MASSGMHASPPRTPGPAPPSALAPAAGTVLLHNGPQPGASNRLDPGLGLLVDSVRRYGNVMTIRCRTKLSSCTELVANNDSYEHDLPTMLPSTPEELEQAFPASFIEATTFEFVDDAAFNLLFRHMGGHRLRGERKLWDHIRAVAFKTLSGRHDRVAFYNRLKSMSNLERIILLPAKVVRQRNENPYAFCEQQEAYVQELKKNPTFGYLLVELALQKAEVGRLTKVVCEPGWKDAFSVHERNRRFCNALAGTNGRLPEVMVELFAPYLKEHLDRLLEGIVDDEMERQIESHRRGIQNASEEHQNKVERHTETYRRGIENASREHQNKFQHHENHISRLESAKVSRQFSS
ncbi:uncharacterized protein BDZ99DRAFT_514108 [Mytilinidion resinicola]|uniref:Uncharacterized protein n=1 Tax=Mytilinidion resinicola TaxID=574789 RepID=A0A6A6ZA46_9PEZI|nr:uncharacterized protein BDZ99DRAFT_514108 [Mytilinidion resinicola]KAF2817886.1 hypothetical protein BDZ99DRAFT_514108 [Mytilinidion resinicola]